MNSRILSTIIVTLIAVLFTLVVAFVACETHVQSGALIQENGKYYVDTVSGLQEYKDVEYLAPLVKTAKPMPITVKTTPSNVVIPASLPHTAVRFGDFNCEMTQNGYTYTFTQTTPCEVK